MCVCVSVAFFSCGGIFCARQLTRKHKSAMVLRRGKASTCQVASPHPKASLCRKALTFKHATTKEWEAREVTLPCSELTLIKAIRERFLLMCCPECSHILRSNSSWSTESQEQELPLKCPKCVISLNWDTCPCCKRAWCWKVERPDSAIGDSPWTDARQAAGW